MKFVNPFKGKIKAQEAFDNVMGKIDDSKFTTQEFNQMQMLKAEKQADFAEKTGDENSLKSKSRRFVTYMVVINFFAAFWATIFLYGFGKVDLADNIKTLAVDWKVVTAFTIVLFFFFGGYYANGIIEKIKRNRK